MEKKTKKQCHNCYGSGKVCIGGVHKPAYSKCPTCHGTGYVDKD